jgi:hypothetical protein
MAASVPRPLVCDLSALDDADLETIDLLARLQLTARRHGRTLRLLDAQPALRELVALAGLCLVLPVEAGWQAEEREHTVGVEEERQLGDPAA